MTLQRLRTRAQFQAVLSTGATVARTAHFALHRLPLDRMPPSGAPNARQVFAGAGARDGWIGAMAPKRWARRAVTRNAVKRQIYVLGAAFEERLQGAAHVVRLRAAFDRARFVSATSDPLRRAVRGELLQLLDRMPAAPPAVTLVR